MKFICAILCISVASLAWAEDSEEGGKIVGGSAATIEKYNYQLSLRLYGQHMCGASLIAEYVAVTAAHCTKGMDHSQYSVRAGSSTIDNGGVVVPVLEVHQHPSYDPYNMDSDVCVLKLSRELPTNNVAIKPISLNTATVATGTTLYVTGWGVLSMGGSVSTTLQVVDVPVVSRADCELSYGQSAITDTMICAGYPEGGKDACQGDSGGPLALNDRLVGIASWGHGCAQANKYGVYTDVIAVASFINTKLVNLN